MAKPLVTPGGQGQKQRKMIPTSTFQTAPCLWWQWDHVL